ncbi:MAG: DUF2914 domain-containing protein [Myxococcota bacterium]
MTSACGNADEATTETPKLATQEKRQTPPPQAEAPPKPEPLAVDEGMDDEVEPEEVRDTPPRAEERRIRPRSRAERRPRRERREHREERHRAPRHKPRLEVIEAALATSVEDRQPVGRSNRFNADVGKVWAWIKVRNSGEGPSPVTMLWKHEGQEIFSTDLKVGVSKGWRTWTRKTISSKRTGRWTVEVRDHEDKLLKKLPFTVEAAPQTAERTVPRATKPGSFPPKTIP